MLAAHKVDAGWDTNAWPSTNRVRFTDTNMWVTVTNLYAKRWEVDLWATSSIAFPGWDTNNWIYRVDPGDVGLSGTSLWATFSVENGQADDWFDLTNYVDWLTEITENLTNHLTFSSTNYTTNSYSITNDGVVNVITEVETRRGMGVQTNLFMDAKDLRAWECYQAIDERWDLLNWDQPPIASDVTRMKFYREERANVIAAKESLRAVGSGDIFAEKFLNLSDADASGYFDTFFSNNTGAISLPTWTLSNLLVAAGAPTNFFDYTPYRQLEGRGFGIAHTVTGTFTIAAAEGATVTNDVVDWGGNSHSITGTNSQVFTFIVTNANILDGYSTLDYGWKHMTNIINRLVWVEDEVDWNNTDLTFTNDWGGIGPFFAVWGDATNDAEGNFSGAANLTVEPRIETVGTLDATPEYTAESYSDYNFARIGTAWTNNRGGLKYTVDVYVKGQAPHPANPHVFDANGTGIFSNRFARVGSAAAEIEVRATGVGFGGTNVGNWTAAPAAGTTATRGFRINSDKAAVKFDGATGLEYK